MKIAILVPYFGRWPEFFPSFLWSLRFSPQFHYHFITDLPAPENAPDNCTFHYQTFNGLQSLIQTKLGISLQDFNPYKLCDFKPTYGHLFDDLIKDYEWWGFGDIDLVLGDVNKYLNEIKIWQYDVINFREFWCSGSLTILRNNNTVRMLYQGVDHWKTLLEDPNHLGIDEASGMYEQLRVLNWDEVKFPYDNFTRLCKQMHEEGMIKAYFRKHIKEYLNSQDWIRVDASGCFDQDGNEFAYYHFISEKKRFFSDFTLPVHPVANYFGHSGAITAQQMQRLGTVHTFRKVKFFGRYIEHWRKRIKNKLSI